MLFEEEHGYGYKDIDSGKIVVAPVYEMGKEYSIIIENENYLAVKKQGKWGLINSENEVVIDFRYDDIGRPRLEKGSPEFVQCFQQKGEGYFKIGIISTKLIVTVPPLLDRFPENITVLDESTCWYYINQGNRWGAVTRDGAVVVELEYEKDEVQKQIIKKCETLIMEYKYHKENIFWIRNAMRTKEYMELFEWE